MRVIFASLLIFGFFQTEGFSADILVRRKSASSIQMRQYGQRRVQENTDKITAVKFSSEEEKQNYIQNLDPSETEWEENITYSGSDYSLNAQVQAEVASEVEKDPLLANQWSLFSSTTDPNKFSGVDIDAIRAWNITTGSDNTIVYIMDSGIVQGAEPDLQGRVTSYFDALNPGQFPVDQNSHGTHVASIVSAIGDNKYGIKGVVPGKIQLGIARFLNASNQGNTDSAIQGIDWILSDYQSRLINNPSLLCIVSNSWDGGYSSFLEDEMAKLKNAGCFLVLSAGNNGRNNDQVPDYPCNFAKLKGGSICVAATDANDKRASFSSYGPKSVDIYAPGTQILGIVPGIMQGSQYVSRYEQKDGTSQAVPHIAGVADLIWSANPKLTQSDVYNILVKSVDRLPGADSEVASGGRVNAYRAVLMATGQDPSLADRGLNSQAAGGGGGCDLSHSKQNATSSNWFVEIGLSLLLLFWLRRNAIAAFQLRADKALRARDRLQNDVDAKNL
ncbi:MAG: putative secreted serine protease [Bacteriovoracaceae bacterium]|nr:putative secreted serine protease [Bacteriovoracaceae bacterium]